MWISSGTRGPPHGFLLFTMIYLSLFRDSRPAAGGPKGGRKEPGDTPAPPGQGTASPAPPAELFSALYQFEKANTIRRAASGGRKRGHPVPRPGDCVPRHPLKFTLILSERPCVYAYQARIGCPGLPFRRLPGQRPWLAQGSGFQSRRRSRHRQPVSTARTYMAYWAEARLPPPELRSQQ